MILETLELYESAINPEVTYGDIFAGVDLLKVLKRAELYQVALALGIHTRMTSKQQALDAITRRITERKESAERIACIGQR